MSYLAYINGQEIDLNANVSIPYTKQVNDLARLDNRQSNFTHKFTVPLTARNIKIFQFVNMVGNQSNLPYSKISFDLIDADTGEHIIYKGWATISGSSSSGYEINVTDGIIDFYKKIENKTLTDTGITELDHGKSIVNIINSWDNLLPYIYAVADYNGKNEFFAQNGQYININTDYQVPSARVSFLWNKIFEFSGFTYSGSYFQTQDFLNLFMSFPNPIKGVDIILNPITIQTPIKLINQTYFSQGNLKDTWEYGSVLPDSFVNAFISGTGTTSQIPGVANSNGWKNILQTKTYRINTNTSWQRELFVNNSFVVETSEFYYFEMKNNLGITIQENVFKKNDNFYFNGVAGYTFRIEVTENATLPFVLFNAISFWGVGGKSNLRPQFNYIQNSPDPFDITVIANIITIEEYGGERVLFSKALNEFNCISFVNEFITRAGLTAFKDRFSNHIEFLTLSEILQSTKIVDWSDKFQYKDSEKYRIGNYGKKNYMRYKYNTQEEFHNDGYFEINDENLQEKINVFNSIFYSPERDVSSIANYLTKVYKIWDKEIKENNILQYKELTGKFYLVRFKLLTNVIAKIGSESLNLNQDLTTLGISNFDRLDFKKTIENNYNSIASILDKAKVIDGYFYLKSIDVEKFDFKSLIYVKQNASYYLVNKINNFTKGKLSKCEIIEVDYGKTNLTINPQPNTATYVTIDNFTVTGCVVTINYSTDASIGTLVNLYSEFFVVIGSGSVLLETFITTGLNNVATFTFGSGNLYALRFVIDSVTPQVVSNFINFDNTLSCIIADPTSLIITAVTLLSNDGITSNYLIDFTTDVALPRTIFSRNYKPQNGGFWSDYENGQIADFESIYYFVSNFIGVSTKFQIKIGALESNEFTI